MKFMSLNVNCFGGACENKEKYKKIYGNRWYNRYWDMIDKSENADKIIRLIEEQQPDIIALQKFDINSAEAGVFIDSMSALGYSIEHEDYKSSILRRPSVTVIFIRNIPHTKPESKRIRNISSCIVTLYGCNIYSIRVPSGRYDKTFWNDIKETVSDNISNGMVIVGDFGMINSFNCDELGRLRNMGFVDVLASCKGAADALTAQDGIRNDYVLATTDMAARIDNMQVLEGPIAEGYLDRAVIAFDIHI